jgi:hypothetical protein
MDGEPIPDDDISELRWFAAGGLPPSRELAFDPLVANVLQAWRHEQP